jgi:hypothetical protein
MTPTGVNADSTPTSYANGQEQGDQSPERRINGLMSLAQRRTAERDQALNEIEMLKAQMAERSRTESEAETGPSQAQLMYPERFVEPEPEVDPMAPPEPPVIEPMVMGVSPSRSQSVPLGAAPGLPNSSPSVRYAQDQAEIASMKSRLNQMGQQWAQEQGLLD